VPHRYVTWVHDESIPIVDVSANAGDTQEVTVSASTTSRMTYGVNLSSGGWHVGGSRSISNTRAGSSGLTVSPGRYTTGRTSYRYVDYRTYYCYATRVDHFDDEIGPASWSGTIYFGSNDLRTLSAKTRYNSASSAGRAGFLEHNAWRSTTNESGRSWTFSMEKVVTLSGQVDYNSGTALTWKNTTSNTRRYYYGTDERPFIASQTYVCDCT